jgi:hypothetical protein
LLAGHASSLRPGPQHPELRKPACGILGSHRILRTPNARHEVHDLGKYNEVELWGFEPQTSCMP